MCPPLHACPSLRDQMPTRHRWRGRGGGGGETVAELRLRKRASVIGLSLPRWFPL